MSKIISDICGSEESVQVLNSGSKDQCAPKPAFVLNMVKDTFEFDDATAARTKAAWDAGKASKDIIPLYKIEEFSANNTEEKKYEGRHQDFITDEAIKGTIYNHILGDCSYDVIRSLKNAGYGKVFIGLSDGTFTCEVKDSGKVAGQPLSSYDVGILNDSEIGGKPQNADVILKFKQHTKSVLKPDFDLKSYEGLYDCDIEIQSASATSIKFKVNPKCSTKAVVGLLAGDVELKDGESVQSVSFVDADANDVYEITGTGFATGFTLDLTGVIVLSVMSIESTGPATITVV